MSVRGVWREASVVAQTEHSISLHCQLTCSSKHMLQCMASLSTEGRGFGVLLYSSVGVVSITMEPALCPLPECLQAAGAGDFLLLKVAERCTHLIQVRTAAPQQLTSVCCVCCGLWPLLAIPAGRQFSLQP
jgi:hypothetical protein